LFDVEVDFSNCKITNEKLEQFGKLLRDNLTIKTLEVDFSYNLITNT